MYLAALIVLVPVHTQRSEIVYSIGSDCETTTRTVPYNLSNCSLQRAMPLLVRPKSNNSRYLRKRRRCIRPPVLQWRRCDARRTVRGQDASRLSVTLFVVACCTCSQLTQDTQVQRRAAADRTGHGSSGKKRLLI